MTINTHAPLTTAGTEMPRTIAMVTVIAALATLVSGITLISGTHADESRVKGSMQNMAQKGPAETGRPTEWDRNLQKQLDGGRRLAVLIGVDAYPDMPLHCCVADVELLSATLRDRCGFDPDLILMLTDTQKDKNRQPTRSNLEREVIRFLANAQQNDTVLFFFSGHGLLMNNEGYLCPVDFDGAKAADTGWRINDVRKMLHSCPAAQKLLVLDSCHSGGTSTEGSIGLSGGQATSIFKQAQGLITFSSCRADEQSVEDRESGHGLFLLSFVQGLEGSADYDQNKIIDSDEIYRYVLSEVPAAVRELHPTHSQMPVRIIGQDVVGVFALSPVLTRRALSARITRLQSGDVVRNSLGMSLVLLPRGCYVKGSPQREYKRRDDEECRAVILSRRILMGVHEVTQREFETVMNSNPSYYSPNGEGRDAIGELKTGRFPVEQISWEQAAEFCDRLSQLPEEAEVHRAYRLPTESEWEFACRAGSMTPFNTGEIIDGKQANIRCDQPYRYATPGEALGRTRSVGSYPPNAFGLCDMHGNVAEWCLDFYEEAQSGLRMSAINQPNESGDAVLWLEALHEMIDPPPGADQSASTKEFYLKQAMNPFGPRAGKQRVIRGGSYLSDVAQTRSAARKSQSSGYVHQALGFRVVCEQTQVKQ